MARAIHGLPKVSPGPALPYPSTSCRLATPETALKLSLRWPTRRVGGLRAPCTPFDTTRRMGLVAIRRCCLVSSLFSFSSKYAFQFTIESGENEQIGLFRACVQFHYKGFTDSFVFRTQH
jgi:hypothetical protein